MTPVASECQPCRKLQLQNYDMLVQPLQNKDLSLFGVLIMRRLMEWILSLFFPSHQPRHSRLKKKKKTRNFNAQAQCNTINETAAFRFFSLYIALNLHDGNVKEVMGILMKNMEAK
jgi:hypothetical protein